MPRCIDRKDIFWPWGQVTRGHFLESLAALGISARQAFTMLESWEHCKAHKELRRWIASPKRDPGELVPITHSDILYLQENLVK